MGTIRTHEDEQPVASYPLGTPTGNDRTGAELQRTREQEIELDRGYGESTDVEPRHRGRTYISDEVVSVVARIAAEQIDGVHQIGESSFRTLLSRLGRHHGIDSEVGMKQAAIDIDLIVEFGYPIRELAQEMREQVITSVERMTGRQVVEVNVHVIDVYVPKMETRGRRRLE